MNSRKILVGNKFFQSGGFVCMDCFSEFTYNGHFYGHKINIDLHLKDLELFSSSFLKRTCCFCLFKKTQYNVFHWLYPCQHCPSTRQKKLYAVCEKCKKWFRCEVGLDWPQYIYRYTNCNVFPCRFF